VTAGSRKSEARHSDFVLRILDFDFLDTPRASHDNPPSFGGRLLLAVQPRQMVASQEAKRHAAGIARRLAVDYADARCALNFTSPLELLIATILSAQCTDTRVNIVTASLFRKYRSAADYAVAPLHELEKEIQSTGFFRNKAKSIKGCCQKLVDEHGGEVPSTLEDLVHLPGVGRKTANVVLGTAFSIASGVVVDTHVTRISRRLGLTRETDAVKIERDLMEEVPRAQWIDFSHRLIHHGRRICLARNPKCEVCGLSRWCPRIGVKPATKNKIAKNKMPSR
jgi:endonuclease-3